MGKIARIDFSERDKYLNAKNRIRLYIQMEQPYKCMMHKEYEGCRLSGNIRLFEKTFCLVLESQNRNAISIQVIKIRHFHGLTMPMKKRQRS